MYQHSRIMLLNHANGVSFILNIFKVLCIINFVSGSDLMISSQRPASQDDVKYNFSGDCLTDLRKVLYNQKYPEISEFWDASGKVSSGIHDSALLWFGSFNQCQRLSQSLYCLADLQVQFPSTRAGLNQTSGLLRWGICAVDSCNSSIISSNIVDILKGSLNIDWVSVDNTQVNCAEVLPFSQGFYATIGIIIALTALCLLGTLFEMFHQFRINAQPKVVHRIDHRGSHLVSPDGSVDDTVGIINPLSSNTEEMEAWDKPPDSTRLVKALKREPGFFTRLAMCFSVVHNMKKIFNTSVPEHTISSLNGIRVISMAWIVLGHTFLGVYASGILENPKEALDYSKNFLWQPIGNAYFAVDTFLFLGGILVSYLTLAYMEKSEGKIPWIRFYLHRYLRLTPCVGFTMLIWIFILPHITSGPLWFSMQSDRNCETYWWTNLLYVQNFYPQSMENQCAGWTWYLTLDMQFYIISPLILVILYKSFTYGISLIVGIIVLSFVATAALIGYFNIDVNLTASLIAGDMSAMELYETVIYEKPYCRIAPYLTGMVLGYILHHERGIKRTIPKVAVCLAWAVVPFVCLATVFRLFWTFMGSPLNRANTILYGTLSHSLWALMLAWIVYSCCHDYAGAVNQILSWHGWAPLSRLTYSVYLVHPLLLISLNNSAHTPFHISNITMMVRYAGGLFLSYAGALLLMLLVEYPVLNLESFFIKTSRTS